MADTTDIFADWKDGAAEIRWQSSTAANEKRELTIFTRRCGTPGAPALVCVHGFPTSSIDYYRLTQELASEFDIYLLDFPGYGLSEKPPAPHTYSLFDDARLLIHAITEVWQLTEYRMVTHDRGSSVGIIALNMMADNQITPPKDIIVTDGNIYLPLSNLTAFQLALLNDETARATAAATTPEALALGLGFSCFMPRRTLDDPEISALAKCFAYNDGIAVLPDTIQYLHERAKNESEWLDAFSKSSVNATLVWGLHDNVSPVRVGNHVWREFLRDKPGLNRYWVIPGADHYVQCDAPAQLAAIIRCTARGEPIALQTLGNKPDGAVLVDQTGTDQTAPNL
jgi:pimeloyl-ACP methyl ester carboxylesterase